MQKVKNPNYRKFLDTALIDTISEDQIKQALKNVTGKNRIQGRALLIALYYTGARPNEVLQLKAKDITRDKSYIALSLPASKGGLPRVIHLPYKNPLVKELYNYSRGQFVNMYIFWAFKNKYVRRVKTKKGVKIRIDTTDRLRYYFNKWFAGVVKGGIPPYFLRHNRFTKLAIAGVSDREIRIIKGSKSMDSVTPYIHLSSEMSKRNAKRFK